MGILGAQGRGSQEHRARWFQEGPGYGGPGSIGHGGTCIGGMCTGASLGRMGAAHTGDGDSLAPPIRHQEQGGKWGRDPRDKGWVCPKPPASLTQPCSGFPTSSKPFSRWCHRHCGAGVTLNCPLQGTEVLGCPALKRDGESAEQP